MGTVVSLNLFVSRDQLVPNPQWSTKYEVYRQLGNWGTQPLAKKTTGSGQPPSYVLYVSAEWMFGQRLAD